MNGRMCDCNSFKEDILKNAWVRRSLSLFHLNTRSLRKKGDQLALYLEELSWEFDVLSFTETWYMNQSDVYHFDGYNHMGLFRSGKRGGGVSLYTKVGLNCSLLHDFCVMTNDIEILTAACRDTIIIVVYRPPSGKTKAFLEYFDGVLTQLSVSGRFGIVLGDINIDLQSASSVQNEFCSMMLCYGYENRIGSATRVTATSETLIDICFTNIVSGRILSGVLAADISDHLAIFCILEDLSSKKVIETQFKTRKINDDTLQAFRELVQEVDWSQIINEQDSNISFNLFHSKIKELYSKAFPVYFWKKHKRARKPWMCPALYGKIKQRNKLFEDWLKHKDELKFKEFKIYRNKVNAELRKAKREYYNRKFHSADQPQKFWKVYKEVTNMTPEFTCLSELNTQGETLCGAELCERFNRHFLTVAMDQMRDRSVFDPVTYINTCTQGTLFLHPTDEGEIKRVIDSLKSNSAPGPDDIKPLPIKSVASTLASPLAHIYNSILRSGLFPDELKIARVTVIHKGGSKDDLNNYRPISLLSVFAKILECLIHKRLAAYATDFHLISPKQFGFCKNKSTETALIQIKEKIIENIEQKLFTVGIFLDLRKAFDSVNHRILIEKLNAYGIRGHANNLIQSYLSNRKQFVKLGDYVSELRTINKGVPQGSILGPLLFLFYINDIENIPFTQDILLYADDTNAFFSGSELKEIEEAANNWLCNLSNWLISNDLQLNIKKTKYILFRARNTPIDYEINLTFHAESLQQTKTIKFLGVHFEEFLSWNVHVNHLKLKMSKVVGALWRVKNLIPTRYRLNTYYAIIQSHLTYCLLIWGKTTSGNLQMLTIMQKKAIRALESLNYNESTRPFFKKYGIFYLEQLYLYKLAVYIYTQRKQNSHSFDNTYLMKNDSFCFRKINYILPRLRTNYGLQSMKYLIPNALNEHAVLAEAIYYPSINTLKRFLREIFIVW